jgi:hypothetical protein
MCFQRNIGFFGFPSSLGASGHRNLLDRSPGGPRLLHSWLNFLGRRLVNSSTLSRRSSRGFPLRLLVISARRNMFYTTQRKGIKNGKIMELAEILTMP